MKKREMQTMDGGAAAAHVSYALSEVSAIYPITPSTDMAETADQWAASGKKNIFGKEVRVTELQSEAGAAGAMHGSLQAGALTVTYTASQGLLLMIPNMYRMAGELLPGVFHVSARTVAAHALSIFGDHSDIYAVRQTGVAMLASTNPQEAMDLGAVAHLAAIPARLPFVHFFDGFRTSHEIQKIETWDYEDLSDLVDKEALKAFRNNALTPNNPVQRGTAQNPDIFFQSKEASNKYYDRAPKIVEEYMDKINKKIGTDYKLFNYYGAEDAQEIIVAMGSVCDTIEETIDFLNAGGKKYGLLKVRLFRPFSVSHMLAEIPKTVKNITVLDRTKEAGAVADPLFLDVITALRDSDFHNASVFAGRYGLAGKNTAPRHISAVYENMTSENPKHKFTVGIDDDVTGHSLEIGKIIHCVPEGTASCKFWGLGSDGTVGANKNSIKIIGDNTDMYAQAHFVYDSKKSGGITVSHLRFGKHKIKSSYEITENADFVACHNPSYIDKYDMVEEIRPGGTFLLNTGWNVDELSENLPNKMKKYIAQNDIKFYTIDGIKIAEEIGLGGRINTILQSAFFSLSDIIPAAEAIELMKAAAKASYGSKGDEIVAMNYKAIDAGAHGIIKVDVPAEWKSLGDDAPLEPLVGRNKFVDEYINGVLRPVNAQKGNELPVSTFMPYVDGTVPFGTSAFEKRGIATHIPNWIPENCIQCNFCAYVCPHAVIRPVVMTEEEAKNAPASLDFMDMTAMPGYKFGIVVSVLDCTGCGSCAQVCPGMKGQKALVMEPAPDHKEKQGAFEFGFELPEKPEVFGKFAVTTVKGSQFKQPLLEFSGACAGCGETPYAKLITQLYGDRMYLANGTGCSSIWGASSPSVPYTVNKKGLGPVWANSLFEDNAEFGYGIHLASETIRDRLKDEIIEFGKNISADKKAVVDKYISSYSDAEQNMNDTNELIGMLEADNSDAAKAILDYKNYLNKKIMWMIGGDGWAYDIGFGGLDHILASGENVNILVYDTEVYSNTGGQASKATQLGATALFAAAGKSRPKKDLAGIAMTYNDVYVAQIAQGANYNQTIKAITEAVSYDGPSIIIAYSPCIAHGIKGGMGMSQIQQKSAIQSGYWHLFRFDPRRKKNGENPFQLDSPAPTTSYTDFLKSEVRFSSLMRTYPERADMLFTEAAEESNEKYEHLLRLSKLYEVN